VTYAAALKTQAIGELLHPELLANRISKLGDRAPRDTAQGARYSTIGPLDLSKHLTLQAMLELAT
jgi:hypothetical protein